MPPVPTRSVPSMVVNPIALVVDVVSGVPDVAVHMANAGLATEPSAAFNDVEDHSIDVMEAVPAIEKPNEPLVADMALRLKWHLNLKRVLPATVSVPFAGVLKSFCAAVWLVSV